MKITVHKNEIPAFAYETMIRRIIRRNYPLLHALHLEMEDVYQDLAITAMQASDMFDPSRSDSEEAHVWMQLQYAILDMKQNYHPAGLTGLGGARPRVTSLEYCEECGVQLTAPEREEPDSDLRLRKALSRLNPQEREAVLLYLENGRRKQRADLDSAFRKLRSFYLAQAFFC